MPDLKLNSCTNDVGIKFKIIEIAVTFGLNAIISSSQVFSKIQACKMKFAKTI